MTRLLGHFGEIQNAEGWWWRQFEFAFEIVRMCECGWCVSTCERWPDLGLNASHHHHFISKQTKQFARVL